MDVLNQCTAFTRYTLHKEEAVHGKQRKVFSSYYEIYQYYSDTNKQDYWAQCCRKVKSQCNRRLNETKEPEKGSKTKLYKTVLIIIAISRQNITFTKTQ